MSEQMAAQPMGGNSNKYFSDYIGVVESLEDPEKLMRVQVRAFGVFTDKVPAKYLPWAQYVLPLGIRVNDGFVIPVKKGDYVWVKFIEGDSRRPLIIGAVHFAPDKKPNMPHEAWAGPDVHSHARIGEEPAAPSHGYHKDTVFTQNGVTIEMNTDKSFSVYQRASGTEINISKAGDITLHSEGNIFFSTPKDFKGIVVGNVQIDVFGQANLNVTQQTTIDTPECIITGNLTVHGGITSTGVYGGASGRIQTPGDIVSTGGEVQDQVRSMSEDRTIYNGHTHPENGTGGGTTSVPNQQE